MGDDKVNILLVDDQPGKLLSHEAILAELGENLIKANSAKQALEFLLKHDVAVVLIDVCMPELDGFQLAGMIREHPRFQQTAIIFISAILLGDVDHLRGYEMGAVDYVPVPVVPEVLRAKVRVFADLYRKTRQLEGLNRELERRVSERTAELEASNGRLLESERRRSLALAAGQMGSWDWDVARGDCLWDEGQRRIFGVDAGFVPTLETMQPMVHPSDWEMLEQAAARTTPEESTYQAEMRVFRPDGEQRWCIVAAAATFDATGRVVRVSGVTTDITDRKQAEERHSLLAREVDHRARNALAVVQAIVRLTHAQSTEGYIAAVEGRIQALAQTHKILSQSSWQGADVGKLVAEELAPYRAGGSTAIKMAGPPIFLPPDKAQTLALALHEIATNAAKYGALSSKQGELAVTWEVEPHSLVLRWIESGGPPVKPPSSQGFGTKIINATIKGQVGGRVAFDWRPEGLSCTLTIPHDLKQASIGREVLANDNLVQLKYGTAKRILLVEDEMLVGMMMRDLLADIGFFVAGPFGSLPEALGAAERDNFDGAVLDVNLHGEAVYPVAEVLRGRKVPFIFVTGYDDRGIDRRYAHVPIVQKPIGRDVLETTLTAALHADAIGRHDPHALPPAKGSF